MDDDRVDGAGSDDGPAVELEGQASRWHDEASEARDRRAEARDRRAEARDRAAEARDRAAPASDRDSATDRADASTDRREGARDRRQAARDRRTASRDRRVSARERAATTIDDLTGAYRRDPGLAELEREMARAKRTGHTFLLAFVDVDGLKATNDSLGHAAGDELLRRVVDTMRTHLRSHDLIVRFGGDEFVCGMSDLSEEEAAKRFALVNADLAKVRQASVTAGFAELRRRESLGDLLARADEELYRARQRHAP